jgi:bifunctional non-homologous end joining protein LigD
MKEVSLYYKEGTSDKEYHIQLEEAEKGFVVNFQYGRVGNALQTGTKTPTPVSFEEAEKIYNKLEKEKRAKGYSDGEKKNDFSQVAPTQNKVVHTLPQLLNTIESVEEYITNDEWLAQEKKDGERRMVVASEKIIGLNKKGTEVPLPNVIIGSVNPIGDKTLYITIDGEIIGGTLFAFDVISLDGKDLKSLSCVERIKKLNSIDFGCNIEVVETAYTTTEKRKMFERLKKENKEGIVFKKKNSPYVHGRPASGGSQLKFKFHKTATFIVKDFTKGKRSVGLELISGVEKVFMGKVTIPPNYEIPNVGDLVEVRYLYAYKRGAVFQPVYLGKRPDSDLTDATMTQIIYKAD